MLFSGIGIAKILSLLSIPLLSRLYSIDEFGVWGTFWALMMIGKTISCGGFQVCLMLPKEESKAKDMLAISYRFNWWTMLVSITGVAMLILLAPTVISSDNIIFFLIAVPVSVFMEGKSWAVHNWLNRKGQYKEMSYGNVAQTGITVALQVLFGWWAIDKGLIWGTLIGQVILMITLLTLAKLPFFLKASTERLKEAFIEYKSFLTKGVPGDLINNSASQLPFVFFTGSFGEAMNGQFSMVQQRVLSAPINLVSAAVSPVFFKEANVAHLAQDGSLRKLVSRFSWIMWALIIVPVLAIVFFGPEIFAFVLGEEWKLAGEYARWLAPLMGVRFVTHPLSYLVDIKHRLRAQLVYNIALLLATVIIFYQPILNLDSFATIKTFGATFFVMQMMFFGYMLHLRKD